MINNQTRLNSSLFTTPSSGGIDNVLFRQANDNQSFEELPIDWDRVDKIPTGNRNTIFLNQLFTNYFFIDFENIAIGSTAIVNFRTTSEFSFSLDRRGNNEIQLIKLNKAKNIGNGTVNNLSHFFKGVYSDSILEFNVAIHRSTATRYTIDLIVNVWVGSVTPTSLITFIDSSTSRMVSSVFIIRQNEWLYLPTLDYVHLNIPHYFKFEGWINIEHGILQPGDHINIYNDTIFVTK